MKTVLVTNDDGYTSSGYIPLLKALACEYHVVAVVPETKKSWIGKAVSAYDSIEIKKITYEGFDLHAVKGTPADCIQIGLYHILSSSPDYVISGINLGTNIGVARLLSSGTVGAAIEASLANIPSLAVSLSFPANIRKSKDLYSRESFDLFTDSAAIACKLSKKLFSCPLFRPCFSVNIPFHATVHTPLEITIPFDASYGALFHGTTDILHHRVPPVRYENMQEGTDILALHQGKISVTPLDLSMVSSDSIRCVSTYLNDTW